MDEYKQDENAGNAGDYLKHLLLIKLIEKVLKEYPYKSIAYIESHAGAGLYNLKEIHRKNRHKYRKLICEDNRQWITFDRLNPLKDMPYFGSFILAGKLLSEDKKRKLKIVLYEKDKKHGVFERLLDAIKSKLSDCDVEPINEEVTPDIIKRRIKELKENGFQIIVCLIDPYKADAEWREALDWSDSGCFILMFDFARAQGKDKGTKDLKFKWHCNEERLIKFPGIKNPANDGINRYAIFGNKQSKDILANIKLNLLKML